jgi:multidrug transporter EmrE-like cation transporter
VPVHAVLYVAYAVLNTGAMAAVKTAMRTFTAQDRRAATASLAVGGALYVSALAVLLVLLKGGPASTVYPIAIGSTVLATNAVGARFYGEQVTVRKVAGTLLVLCGIVLILVEGPPL